MVKIAVVPPMPKANVRVAAAVKTGDLRNCLKVYRRVVRIRPLSPNIEILVRSKKVTKMGVDGLGYAAFGPREELESGLQAGVPIATWFSHNRTFCDNCGADPPVRGRRPRRPFADRIGLI